MLLGNCKLKKVVLLYTYQNDKEFLLTIGNAGEDVKQQEFSFIAGGTTKWHS